MNWEQRNKGRTRTETWCSSPYLIAASLFVSSIRMQKQLDCSGTSMSFTERRPIEATLNSAAQSAGKELRRCYATHAASHLEERKSNCLNFQLFCCELVCKSTQELMRKLSCWWFSEVLPYLTTCIVVYFITQTSSSVKHSELFNTAVSQQFIQSKVYSMDAGQSKQRSNLV